MLGRNDNGYTIWYLMEGEPDAWPILVQGIDGSGDFHRYDMPLTAFLAQLFEGRKPMAPWPKGWFGKRRSISFEPSELKERVIREKKSIYQLYIENGNKAGFWLQDDDGAIQKIFILVKSIGGKQQGELPGAPPDFSGATVLCDFFGPTGLLGRDSERKFAEKAIYYRVDPPEQAEQAQT